MVSRIVHVTVDGLQFQKDKLRVRTGHVLDEHEFMASTDKEADVLDLKRFVVTGQATLGIKSPLAYKIIVDLRGHTAVFTCDENGPITPYGLYWLFEVELTKWNHRREHGNDTQRPLLTVEGGREDSRIVATTRDAYWLAGVLHQISQLKGFKRDIDTSFVR